MARARHCAAAVMLGGLLATAAAAGSDGLDLGAAPRAARVIPVETTLYLEVSIAGEPTQDVIAFFQGNGRLLVDVQDLEQLGLRSEALRKLRSASHQPVELDTIPGLRYHYDPGRQTIDLQPGPELVAPHAIGGRAAVPATAATATGLVLNYDAFLQGGPDHGTPTTLSLSNEERLFSRLGVFDNSGVASAGGGHGPYVRLDSLWHFDDPAQLTTAQAGDAISSSLSWSRAVRMGGFQFRRNFALRPDLITFPLPILSGSAAVPSAVDVYINNVRQFSGQVPGGPFIINNPVALTGAGEARVVVRDELGREVSATLPLYVDNRMMAAGLDSYSMEGGLLRRNYGLRSFDYGGSPALSGSYRYGWSDALTFEAHAEGSPGLYNGGGGGLLRLGQWGVINAALAAGLGASSGMQGSAGYQLILPRFSFAASTTRNSTGYRDLASIDGTPPPKAFDQVNIALPLWRTQSFGFSYLHVDNSNGLGGESRIASLSYITQLRHWCSLFVNGYQELDTSHGRGFWIGLSIDFGDRLVGFANAGRSQGQTTYGASLIKTADYDGGWQWGLQDSEGGAGYQRLARSGYLGRYGEVDAAAQDDNGHPVLSLEGSGGLVFMDGVFEPSRRIYDSFALVSTDGMAGIPVLNENRVIGRTDGSGHLLVPDLNSYQDNHLAIDSMGLPADASVPVTRADVAPRSQSGILARFSVRRYTAATVILVNAAGQPLAAGTVLRHAESGQDFVVGYDGQAFIENLQPDNHLSARGKNLRCSARFAYRRPADDNILPVIGPVSCRPDGGTTP